MFADLMRNSTTEVRSGLDNGESGAKLVALSHTKDGITVNEALIEEEPFEPRITGNARPQQEIARQVLIKNGTPRCKTVFADNQSVSSCFVILPNMPSTDADGAILLQARKLLFWEGMEPLTGHMDSDFLRGRTGSVVGLANWASAKQWCSLIEDCGAVADDITVRACAYQALADHQNWHKEHSAVLVADLGASASRFFVLNQGTVQFMREVPVAGDAITKVLTTQVVTDKGGRRLSETEAEKLKVTGDLTDAEMALRPLLERISSEIMRSIQFFNENTGEKIDAVFVTGGSSSLTPLTHYLQSSISVPISAIDPFRGMNLRDATVEQAAEKHASRLAVAAGLALARQPAISLMPRSLQLAKRATKYAAPAIASLLRLGFLPLVLAGAVQMARIYSLRTKLEAQNTELAAADASGPKLQMLLAENNKVSAYHNALHALMVREPLWPGILNDIANAVPEHIVLTRCATKSDQKSEISLVLVGRVLPNAKAFDDAVSSLLSKLSSSVFFRNVAVAKANANRTANMLGTFEIHVGLVY